MSTYIVAITGASGAAYARRLLEVLSDRGDKICLLISESGKLLVEHELGIKVAGDEAEICAAMSRQLLGKPGYDNLVYHHSQNLLAGIASGSVRHSGMIILPCSMGTLSRIAHGNSGNLIERAADVTLKERRPLILAPRETPLNQIHLANMLKLAQAGAWIVPCMPAFYNHPKSIDDIVNFVAGRVLDTLNIPHQLYTRWA